MEKYKCISCSKLTDSECSECGKPLCEDIDNCPPCPCLENKQIGEEDVLFAENLIRSITLGLSKAKAGSEVEGEYLREKSSKLANLFK